MYAVSNLVMGATMKLPFVSKSATSKAAAQSSSKRAPKDRERVLKAIAKKPMTDGQIALSLKMSPNTARPRRVELCALGLVHSVGTSKTSSGRLAQVWGVK